MFIVYLREAEASSFIQSSVVSSALLGTKIDDGCLDMAQ